MFQVRFVRVALLNILKVHRTRGEKLQGACVICKYFAFYIIYLRTMHNSSQRQGHLNFGCWRTLTSSGTTVISSAACVFATGRALTGFDEKVIQRTTRNSTAGEVTSVVWAPNTSKSRNEQIESTIRSFITAFIAKPKASDPHAFQRDSRTSIRRISSGSLQDRFVVSQRRAFHDYQIELQFWKNAHVDWCFLWNKTIPPTLLFARALSRK